MENNFEELGYFKEYFVGSKFIGVIKCEKDREVMGYNGRKIETLSEDTILGNKQKLKKGVEVTTYLQILCGKMLRK